VIDNAGRSKAYINGIAATAGQLRELGELLVDIHGQHAHQSLLKTDAQRALLDNQARCAIRNRRPRRRQCRLLQRPGARWRASARNSRPMPRTCCSNASGSSGRSASSTSWRQAGRVDRDHQRAQPPVACGQPARRRAGSAGAISESEHPILSQLSSLNQKLGKLVDVDAGLQAVLDCMEPARIQLQEAVYALNDYIDKVELDPARLRQVDARMDAIHSTARKFRVTPEELPEEHATWPASCAAGRRQRHRRPAQAGRKTRRPPTWRRRQPVRHAPGSGALGEQVSEAMQELSMSGGRFVVALNPASRPCMAWSRSNSWSPATPAWRRVRWPRWPRAANWRASRWRFPSSPRNATTVPTLIFDEVDSGIGGGVAEVVGRLLKRLGQERQVLCVTHLPQVASQANQHFQVAKGTTGERQDRLAHRRAGQAKARVEEVARMLGGLEITETTRKHARELLAS
jgi:DNA repair protein RecN (Recombination protein N)